MTTSQRLCCLRRTSIHIASRHSASRRGRELCEVESMAAGTSQLKVQVLNNHHCVISVLLWLEHAGVRQRQRFASKRQLAPFLWRCPQMSLVGHSRCFHGTPWPLHGVKYCSIRAHPDQLRCIFDPSSPEDLFLTSQALGQGMCAIVLRDICR